jgi:hypothetical protein
MKIPKLMDMTPQIYAAYGSDVYTQMSTSNVAFVSTLAIKAKASTLLFSSLAAAALAVLTLDALF